MYLTQGLHRAVQQRADRVATVCAGRTRTWAEVGDRVARLAAALQELGIRDGARAAILSLNSDRFSEFLAATLWAGGVVVPVNFLWPVPQIAESLAEVDARVLIVDDVFAGQVDVLKQQHPGLQHVVHAGDGPTPPGMAGFEALIERHAPVEDALRRGADLAGVFYTGGTTGRAKGVMLSHDNLLTTCLGGQAAEHYDRDGVGLMVAPMFHLAAFSVWVGGQVLGATGVILPAFDPVAVMSAIEQHAVTDVMLVPTMIQMVVDHPRVAEFDLTRVRHVLYGASPMSDALLDRAAKVTPGARFLQAYGMTEVAPVATYLLPADHEDPVRRRSVGRAAPHAEVRIVGPDDVELPRGQAGEIVVRGGNVMLGYWNRPQETAEALRGGWMHTGDGGRMDDDGYVYLTDRIKDMIISGGENVYSVEVENVLADHPAVASCAVIGVPDETWGERVHAVVVPAGRTLTLDELRAFCRDRLAGYQIPRSLELREALPLSPVGKVLKTELRRPHWQDQERGIH